MPEHTIFIHKTNHKTTLLSCGLFSVTEDIFLGSWTPVLSVVLGGRQGLGALQLALLLALREMD